MTLQEEMRENDKALSDWSYRQRRDTQMYKLDIERVIRDLGGRLAYFQPRPSGRLLVWYWPNR